MVIKQAIRIVSAAAVLPYAASAVEPASIPVGGLSLTPTVDLRTGHDDNIFRTEDNEVSSWITVLSPRVELVAEKANDRYSLSYDMERGVYHSSQNDNYLDHELEGQANIELNSRNRLDLLAAYLKTHNARGDDDGGVLIGPDATLVPKPLRYSVSRLSGIYTYGSEGAKGRIEAKLDYKSRVYQNFREVTAGRDRDTLTAGLTFYYRIAPKTRALVEVRRTSIDYDITPTTAATLDSNETKYLVGLTWDATAKTSGTIKVGRIKKDFDAATRNDESGSTWEAALEWAPRTYSVFTLTAGQELDESAGGNDYIDTRSWGLNWSHGWNDRFTSQLAYSSVTEEYNVTQRKDETDELTIGVNYDFRRWLTAGLGYTYSDRDSNFDGFGSSSNVFMMTVQGSM